MLDFLSYAGMGGPVYLITIFWAIAVVSGVGLIFSMFYVILTLMNASKPRPISRAVMISSLTATVTLIASGVVASTADAETADLIYTDTPRTIAYILLGSLGFGVIVSVVIGGIYRSILRARPDLREALQKPLFSRADNRHTG